MHKCLDKDLIQREIFLHVYEPSWHWPEEPRWNRRDVANLALTCSAFYESAMDILWSHLDNLGPLIRTMSPQVWSVRNFSSYGDGQRDVTYVALVQEPSTDDWNTFLKYAQRVQSLRFAVSQDHTLFAGRDAKAYFHRRIHWNILKSFNMHFTSLMVTHGPADIFPRLRSLSFYVCSSSGWTLAALLNILLCRGESLQRIHISFESSAGAEFERVGDIRPLILIHMLCDSISEHCSNLQEIHITQSPCFVRLQDTPLIMTSAPSEIADVITNLHHLSYLNISHVLIELPLLESLKGFAHLAHLAITVNEDTIRNYPFYDDLTFPALRQLTLDVDDLQSGTAALTNIFGSCGLVQIKILAPETCMEAEQLESFYKVVARFASLEDLRLGLRHAEWNGLRRVVDLSILTALFPLRDLHTFHIYSCASRSCAPAPNINGVLTVATTHILATAWPHLRSLRFQSSDDTYGHHEGMRVGVAMPSSTSLELLCSIQRSFPRLRDLSLCLDGGPQGMPSDELLQLCTSAPDHPLEFLSIGSPSKWIDYSTSHSEAIAVVLFALFPHIQNIHSRVPRDWMVVKEMYSFLQEGLDPSEAWIARYGVPEGSDRARTPNKCQVQ